MIGLDTNVVLRLLTDDDPAQVAAARALLQSVGEAPDAFHIDHVVLAECAWALRAAYAFDRQLIADGIRALTDVVSFDIEDRDVVLDALAAYESGLADFSDCLIAARNVRAGCAYTATFDRRASRLEGMMAIGGTPEDAAAGEGKREPGTPEEI
ncbi:MAG: PIN domain-containing protein [Alphaproteobacteria bacterium]|nr:PIN domain-containing protein [Alphaproteobacteria bacterium]